jgi:DNA replication and repair protein RecF
VGPNGQGKTNIVEAIRYLATLGSHRVNGSGALIGDGEERATIFGTLRNGERDVSVGVSLKRSGASEATVSGNPAKVSEVPRWVSAVMFAPEDSAIVRGEPGFRRQFLDDLVISTSPSMAAVYADFDRVLRQRNKLLKTLRSNSRSSDLSSLEVWNTSFVSLAAEIVSHRRTQWANILPHVSQAYEHLAGGHEITADYIAKGYVIHGKTSREEILERISQALLSVEASERERGLSLVGPQRDDLELMISRQPARTHASQGETWSLALSLRLGTAAWLRDDRPSGDPIIILDDVFAELDARRRAQLVSVVAQYEQLIVTSAVEEDIPHELHGKSFDVNGGVVVAR